MKLAQVTDIHLNFLEPADRKIYYQDIIATKSNAVLVSGDITEVPTISDILEEMAQHITKPIYFVLSGSVFREVLTIAIIYILKIMALELRKINWS